jgi:hypothetical protein
MAATSGILGESRLEYQIKKARIEAVRDLYEGGSISLHLTHLGRVRLSELKQALRTDRE